MQTGSLVTPRWPLDQLKHELFKFAGPKAINLAKELPIYQQIYTVSEIGNLGYGVEHCLLEELVVYPGELFVDGKECGLPVSFYVEVDPPQENVQSIVDEIIISTSVLERV